MDLFNITVTASRNLTQNLFCISLLATRLKIKLNYLNLLWIRKAHYISLLVKYSVLHFYYEQKFPNRNCLIGRLFYGSGTPSFTWFCFRNCDGDTPNCVLKRLSNRDSDNPTSVAIVSTDSLEYFSFSFA